ncbi:MAG: GNAT family N-acetyltransferase [Salibacteraceae bacterium]|jgi:predicted GNAT family N-acyltransferase|nr:GNAT family N-acetyltransferase [Salibacteraceae bacterium]MDP4685781.1 GNAT family N-acetyltransferase [Salibacteraceae bacterium]MDP4762670.1 GNAT family N-acetyltransferase [Salibacteraceae bacterium]MDP4844947.1 GNAT family N-acetyltransferase [Salibacteraceae bacterium]MDP4933134.1 GNAT family N-acetyltransferase [Salibacteraceae bacterium]
MGFSIEIFDSKIHNRNTFNCEEESLSNYLKHQASQDIKKKLATCFVLLESGSTEIKGYYTLSSESIDRKQVPEKYQKKIPLQYTAPVILLGRLARDITMKGSPAGKILLADALTRSLSISKTLGAMAVVVYPINDFARTFYANYGFVSLPDSGRMFIALSTVEQLF